MLLKYYMANALLTFGPYAYLNPPKGKDEKDMVDIHKIKSEVHCKRFYDLNRGLTRIKPQDDRVLRSFSIIVSQYLSNVG